MTTTTTLDDVAVLDPEHVGDICGAGAISRGEGGTGTSVPSEGLLELLRCSRSPANSAHGHRVDDGARNRWRIGNGPRRVPASVHRSPHQGQPER
ncbi:MAG TPA: hypothetical protein VFP54_06085 [Acidimicrobiales bacterium]|nr:hypothetical protein [Acidimicrobiales bacterium]